MANTSDKDSAALRAEIERLTAALSEEKGKVAAAEASARAAAEAQSHVIMQREITEVPTGKTVEVARCKKYSVEGYRDDGREIRKPVFEKVTLPTFFYKIDLPASGGQGINLNGEWFYHGEVYTIDLDLLRTLKDAVHRAWAHEAQIKGNNENIFRKPSNVTLRGVRA